MVSENGSTAFTCRIPVDLGSYPEALKSDLRMDAESEIYREMPYVPATPEEINTVEERSLVLVVEDDPELREFITKILLVDYEVIDAKDGQEGLEYAFSQIPDLIVSDLMMPHLDGIALTEKLKSDEKTSHIPIVLLTAKATMDGRMEGLDSGADDYLTKPFHAPELKIRIKNLIAQRALLRQRFSRTVVLKPKDISISSIDEIFLKKVMDIMELHLDDVDFSIEQFQREIGLSRMQLHRKLKALTDHSTSEFIRTQRLIRASELLGKNVGNVSEVCYMVGFTNLSYFSKIFKEQFGVTPSEYQPSGNS